MIEMLNRLVLGFAGFLCFHSAISAEQRWTRMASPNFEMYTTAGERSARDTLRYFEQVRGFFARSMPQAVAKASVVRIVAFSSIKEYEPYRLNEFATAYYHNSGDRDYIVMSHTGAETFPIAIHEYVHLVIRHAGLKFPPWLNEGFAELYSTLKPTGDKILVGALIPGRFHALLAERWVPLTTILNSGHDSPFYNEKDKAGSLYNESWALTHMLSLSNDYRSKFSQAMNMISQGSNSVDALEKTYGKSIGEIEADLRAYLRGGRFQAMLFPMKLDKITDDLNATPADEFDVKLLLSEVAERPGREAETRKSLEELVAANPKRPEAYVDLGYLDLRQRHSAEAREHFGKAFDLGARGPRLLWEYGRLTESGDPVRAIVVLAELLKQEPDRLDVRIEVASLQIRTHVPKDALQTLAPVKKVTPENAPKVLTLIAYASLDAGDRDKAREAANELKKVSTSAEERERADGILRIVEAGGGMTAAPPLPDSDSHPVLPRQDSAPAPASRTVRTSLLTYTGKFVELQCGAAARIVIETAEGRKVLLIEDPSKVLINGNTGVDMDLSCGPQKPVEIRVEYDPPGPNRPGIDGIIRALNFQHQ